MEILQPYVPEDETIQTPVIRVDAGELGVIGLHWFNSRIRKFIGRENFNHAEYSDEDDNVHGFLSPELVRQMQENNFPTLELPYVDVSTFKWLFDTLVTEIPEEPEGFGA
jgi:hypothetical protein